MSLSFLVRHPTPVRDRLATDFPRPRVPLDAELLVPSFAPSPQLIGTAYDYLLRFHLLRAMPFAQCHTWVAESALEGISRFGDMGCLPEVGSTLWTSGQVRDQMTRIIARAKRLLSKFLAGEPLSVPLIRSAINLAHCDLWHRIWRLDANFGKPHADQVEELRRMVSVADLQLLRASKVCMLNPTFGEGSVMIGGADADLVLDDALIDIKTTAKLRLLVDDWRQLIAYAALNQHFPVGGAEPHTIRRIGIYFARYNHLACWPLDQLVDMDKFVVFAGWLRDYIKKLYRKRRKWMLAIEERSRRRQKRSATKASRKSSKARKRLQPASRRGGPSKHSARRRRARSRAG